MWGVETFRTITTLRTEAHPSGREEGPTSGRDGCRRGHSGTSDTGDDDSFCVPETIPRRGEGPVSTGPEVHSGPTMSGAQTCVRVHLCRVRHMIRRCVRTPVFNDSSG